MQNPHWAAPVSRNACCSGSSRSPTRQPLDRRDRRRRPPRPPSTRHESTLSPSTSTVHAPHSPTRQHSFVPVSAEIVAKDVEQRVVRRDVDGPRAAVDGELDAASSRAPARRSMAVVDRAQPEHAQHREAVLGARPHRRRRRARVGEQLVEPGELRARRRRTGPRARRCRRRRAPAVGRRSRRRSASRRPPRPRTPASPTRGRARAGASAGRARDPRAHGRARQLDRRDELARGRAS